MDGKIARQLLFKKKLEEENKEAEEKLRAKWKSEKASEDSRLKVHYKQVNGIEGKARFQLEFNNTLDEEKREARGKQNVFFRTGNKETETQFEEKLKFVSKRKTLISELEQMKSVKRNLQQEEAVHKMLEVKIHSNGVERANRLTDITRRMSMETQNLQIQKENLANAQYSIKLQRKTHLKNDSEMTENEFEENFENQGNASGLKKKTKTAKRLERETEQRRKLLYERAEALKQKRADKLKEQFENLKYTNERRMDELEKEKLSIEAKEREERKNHELELELITEKLNDAECKINELDLAITYMNVKIQEVEQSSVRQSTRTTL